VLELLRSLPSQYQIQVAVLERAGKLLGEGERLGYVPAAFPLQGSVARGNTARQIARLALWLRARRAELVHAHDFYSSILAVPAAKLASCKVVVGRLDLAHWHSPIQRRVLRLMTRLADHVIANAQAVRRMLIDEGISRSRISVIRYGLDLAQFDGRAEAGLRSPLPALDTYPVALLVANMNHPVKRQEDFLRALSILRREGNPIRALLVGDGPRRASLEDLARHLGLERIAYFLGHRTDIPAIYSKVAVGVLCSSAEGLSNAIIEGMAARRPMVVTNVGGNPELVAPGERGLVVEPDRPADLAAALRWILAHPLEADRIGMAGRAYVASELSLAWMAKRQDALYRAIVRDPGRAHPVAHPEPAC